MKGRSPKQIARLTALANVGLLAILFVSIGLLINGEINWLLVFLLMPITFFVSYFLIYYSIEWFINQRIKLIYKTIHREKTGKNKDKQLDMESDVLNDVNRDVIKWAQDNRDEIQELKQQEAFRRDFIGNLSHELKTPIFNIQGYLFTLLEGGLEDERINEDYLKKADKNLDRVIALIKDLDMINKLESGEDFLTQEKFDIVEVASDVLSHLELKAADKEINLVFNKRYDKPIFVRADRDKIYQVITNLVINSINYGKKKGKTEVRFYDMDENILVEVADDGIGIAAEHLPRLFERFYRVDRSRARHQGGTGLGLAIVKHIIESHKQTINVRSTQGEGSTFSFTLKKVKA